MKVIVLVSLAAMLISLFSERFFFAQETGRSTSLRLVTIGRIRAALSIPPVLMLA